MSLSRVFDDLFWPTFYYPHSRFPSGNHMLSDDSASATETEYTFSVNVPGYGSEDLDISVDEQARVLRVKNKVPSGDSEGPTRSLYWSRSLPRDADLAQIKASVDKGVLTFTVSRVPPQSHVRQIELS